ncbi:hypothetical protein [Mycobacterium vicinigordonae]|uniref:Uncharacterized protein n=1 Tax=Mycobacterium vicinigordonae TaxID=1719132 RepID=A0A7D6HQE0_9MYCO|nr:hypothetical protein [Mycobacterium vicinigordonae]QLL07571.1 hypothetical protein H0P51_00620 [Mycobacterium vicinigordonae]
MKLRSPSRNPRQTIQIAVFHLSELVSRIDLQGARSGYRRSPVALSLGTTANSGVVQRSAVTKEPTAAVGEFVLPATGPDVHSRSLCHNPHFNRRKLDTLAVSDFDEIATPPRPPAGFLTAAMPLGAAVISEVHCPAPFAS